MRTLLIIVLASALAAAAFVTRPGKRHLMLHLLDERAGVAGNWSHADLDYIEHLTRNATFNDRWLYTQVEKDGKTLYTGLFGHYISHGGLAAQLTPSPADLAKVLSHRLVDSK